MFFSKNLANSSSNRGKLHFEGLVHLLRYLRDNKNLELRYFSEIEYAPLYEIFRQAIIKTENQLVVFSDYICQECPDTGRSKGSYIVFYHGGTIDHCTHVPGTVSQSSAESEWNTACTACMYLSKFSMLNNELFNKDPYVVPEQAHIIILGIKSSMFMDKNGKDTKNTWNIFRRTKLCKKRWIVKSAKGSVVWGRSVIGRYWNQ